MRVTVMDLGDGKSMHIKDWLIRPRTTIEYPTLWGTETIHGPAPADELATAKRVLNRDLRAVLGGWARKLT